MFTCFSHPTKIGNRKHPNVRTATSIHGDDDDVDDDADDGDGEDDDDDDDDDDNDDRTVTESVIGS